MNTYLAKVNQTLFFFVLLTVVLYFGKPVLVPFTFAVLLAMLMAPVCRWLDSRGMHRIVSSLVCVFILLIALLAMMGILVGQISSFVRDIPLFEQRTEELLLTLQQFIHKKFGIPVAEQTAFVKSETRTLSEWLRGYLTGVLTSSLQLLIGLVITVVLTFLFLFQMEKYYAFFLKITRGDTREQKEGILASIGKVSQHYLVGRAISIIVLFVLYLVALLFIGIQNAWLLAAVAALVNIIPYLGPVLAAVFPTLVALVTESSHEPAIWVLVSFMLFQAIDNYFVTPYFLGGEVSLSALSTILAMICGGFIWGVSGMILFIPMLSIAKIIFDYVPGLEHYGYLIGDQGEKPSKNIGAWLRSWLPRHRKAPPKV